MDQPAQGRPASGTLSLVLSLAGAVAGGILGVLFIALIENAMIINAVGVFWQGLVVGLVLLFAVSLDRFKSSGRT